MLLIRLINQHLHIINSNPLKFLTTPTTWKWSHPLPGLTFF